MNPIVAMAEELVPSLAVSRFDERLSKLGHLKKGIKYNTLPTYLPTENLVFHFTPVT